jgi:enterobactin synthetase component D / holo-[acyl-carrier protein] synthase
VIEEILPAAVVVEDTHTDTLDCTLFVEEEVSVGRAVAKRRREFTTARACARLALARLDLPAQPIPAGPRGEPLWPAGVRGSITHCQGYRACALGRASEFLTVGIDAEPNGALPDGLLGDIACAEEERAWLRDQAPKASGVCWDRLLFSAKESVYKAWFPLAQSWLGFEDAVLTIDPQAGTFRARLLVPGPMLPDGRRLTVLHGRWLARDGLILTAIAPGVGSEAVGSLGAVHSAGGRSS